MTNEQLYSKIDSMARYCDPIHYGLPRNGFQWKAALETIEQFRIEAIEEYKKLEKDTKDALCFEIKLLNKNPNL